MEHQVGPLLCFDYIPQEWVKEWGKVGAVSPIPTIPMVPDPAVGLYPKPMTRTERVKRKHIRH